MIISTRSFLFLVYVILYFGKGQAQSLLPTPPTDLPPGTELVIRFKAQINPNTPTNVSQVSLQGTIDSAGVKAIQTDDPETLVQADPTVTHLGDPIICMMPPIAVCQPATVVLSAVDGTGTITGSEVDGGSTDACGIANLSVSPSTFDCSMVGPNNVTLTVTDLSGNNATCTATVTVDDSQSKPATLAQQSCRNCGQIRIFYCQYDQTPASLNAFIDGTIATNANFVAGNTLFWYDDNGGARGGDHLGTGQQPATPNMSIGNATYWYWVAQIDQNTGCFGDPIRVRIRVRKSPTPVFSPPPTPFCEGGQLNLANLVDDPNNVADLFEFYDGDPNAGGQLIGSITATNGAPDVGQVVAVTPAVGTNTYWVVATNVGNNNTITCPAATSMSFVVSPKPIITPIADLDICPGENVQVNFNSVPGGGFLVWLNSDVNIGLASNGLGNINFTAAANASGNPIVSNITAVAVVNGCVSNVEAFNITLNSDAVIDPASSVTVCSGQSTGMVLTTALGSPAATSYELVSVSLDPGLTAGGSNQAPATGLNANALSGDVYTNTTSGSLTATYRLRTVTGSNCTSGIQTITATILAEPDITSGLADTVCSGQAANLVLSTTNSLPGTSFNWSPQLPLPPGVNLVNSSSPGTVITDILTNISGSPVDVVFELSAQSGSCVSGLNTCTIRVVSVPTIVPTASLDACEDPLTPGQATFNLANYPISGRLTSTWYSTRSLQNQIPSPGSFVSGPTTVYAAFPNPGTNCPSVVEVTLSVISISPPLVSSTVIACSNTSQEITPTPVIGVSFNFYDNDPDLGGLLLASGASYDPMLSTGQSTTIWVTATTGQCESEAVSVSVTVNPSPTAQATALLTNGSICEGDTLELFGLGGGTYSWTGPNGFNSSNQNPIINGLSSADEGDYILTVTHALGCSDRDTVQVLIEQEGDPGGNGFLTIAANALPEDLFDYLTGNPEQGGVWAGPSPPYNGDQGTFNPNFMPSGVYTYSLTNPSACQHAISFATVTVNVTPVIAAKVRAKIYLEGVLDTTSLLMIDSLRKNQFLPTAEPYSQLGYAHVNGGGNEAFDLGLLDSTGVNALVDWGYIELRSSTDSTQIVATRSVLLQRDGDVVDLDGISPVCFNRVTPGLYYVVIGHRNHLPVMTAIPVFLNSTGTISLDFTSGPLAVFGTNPMNVTATSVVPGGVKVMIGGDADFNGQIQNADDVMHWIPYVGGAGYRRADYNCDGEVQNNDRVFIWNPNVGKGTQVPD